MSVHEPPEFSMRPEVQAVYDKFARDHYGEIDVPLLCETLYNAGGRAATQALLEFGDLLPLIDRLERRVRGVRDLLERMFPE